MSSTKKQQRIGAKQRSIQTGFKPPKTSILGKGLGYLSQQRFLNWNRIEKIARANGVYTPAELARLLREHSPIKRIGSENLYICKLIYDGLYMDHKKSFYAVAKDNLERIMVLQGMDPRLIDWGTTWKLAQKSKNKKVWKDKNLKHYTQLLKNTQKKYNKIMNNPKDEKIFLTWHRENKDDAYIHFIDKIIKKTISKS